MADTATAPVADAGQKRAEKPDEAKYKSDLAEAEKAHKAAQAEFVCYAQWSKTKLIIYRMRLEQNLMVHDLAKEALVTIDGNS